MLGLRRAIALSLLAASALAGCGGASSTVTAPTTPLPGVDTAGFTEREQHELADYVHALPAPCKDLAVPLGQCLSEHRSCAACLPAAQAVARAVREGMAREQVEDLYKQRFDPSRVEAIALDGSPSRGADDAPVVIVEFADFECPFCQKVAPELDALWEKRRDKLRFVYKFMPLTMHPHGEPAARAAYAAHLQGKFWPMEKLLFANGQHLEPAEIEGYAKAAGLDLDRFKADLAAPEVTARIDADRKLADKLGVKGTPTLFIDGREYDSKVPLEEWIDTEIAARARPR